MSKFSKLHFANFKNQCLWQNSEFGQLPQSQPQLTLFPAFLSFIIFLIISITAAARRMPVAAVPIIPDPILCLCSARVPRRIVRQSFPSFNLFILCPLFRNLIARRASLSVYRKSCRAASESFIVVLVRTNKHIDECYGNDNCCRRSDAEAAARCKRTELIYHERYGICKYSLISDCE